jgi:hypothetical protein
MKIACREQFLFPGLKPSLFVQTLAFGTVSISARVIGDPQQTTMIAFIHMTTQLGGPADLNGMHGTEISYRHLPAMGFTILGTERPKNIGHLYRAPHLKPAFL